MGQTEGKTSIALRERRSAAPRCDAALHHVYQSIRGDRFPQHAVGVEVVVGPRLTGDDDHRDVTRVRVRFDFLPHGGAAQQRQSKIEHDGMRRVGVEDAQRIEAVPRFHDVVAGKRQGGAKHASKIDIVFDDENGLHGDA